MYCMYCGYEVTPDLFKERDHIKCPDCGLLLNGQELNHPSARQTFKEQVFARDKGECVLCPYLTGGRAIEPAVDAHHIIDRSLWDDGGYFIDNGVSLCAKHHLDAERTLVSCEDLRKSAGILKNCYPEHFYSEDKYDHWGNIVLPSGMRIKGELFEHNNVQKALKEGKVLDQFLKYVKQPRTYHLPDSPNLENDDKQHKDISFFEGKQVVASLKMDGESCSMYPDHIHARAIESNHHESQSWVKALHARIKGDIPVNWRLCGENLYAEHSIHYRYLTDFFYIFSIWDQCNYCLPVKETLEYCDLMGLVHVPILYNGIWDREKIHRAFLAYNDGDDKEGYVIRLAEGFYYRDYRKCTAKWVREGHVRDLKHWKNKLVIPNEIRVVK
jgi:hypothetical protein